MAVQNILPDPNNVISPAGDNGGGSNGPGFASVKLSSEQPIMRDRTNGGTLVSRAFRYHTWDIQISYNPLTKTEFDPVYSFLLEKRGSLKPFYVSLPQYRGNSLDTTTTAAASAGQNQLTLTGYATLASNAKVGDLFHIVDSNDSTHTKAYKVVRVETAADKHDDTTYDISPDPTGDQRRITFNPPLKKAVSSGAAVKLNIPLIYVIQSGDIQEYSLGVNSLYSFSLKLEEACY
jgi:hypothetical protein